MLKSEIRKDYFLNKYVIITPGRAKRPRDIKEQTIVARVPDCPFCLDKIDKNNIKDKIGQGNDWEILSLGNVFPAVSPNNKKAYGVQEVIVETTNHSQELHDLSDEQIKKLLYMYAKRTEALTKIKNIDYILCFKNQGSKAGASMTHAHSQVFATSLLPPDINEELCLAFEYKNKNRSCVYCDIIKKESKSPRKVYEDSVIVAFTPYASQYHYELWIFPKRHLDNITKLNEDEYKSLAKFLKKALLKLHAVDLSYNFFLHQIVSYHDQHFYLKIQPRDSVWAGVELGSGLVINSLPPEQAAKYYQQN